MPIFKHFFEDTTEANSQDELYALYRKAVEQYGFDIFVHSFITEHSTIHKPREDHYHGPVLAGWYERYVEKEYWNIDPIRQSLYKRPGARTWSDIASHEQTTPEQQLFLREVDDAGFHSGITVPIYGPRGEIAALSVASTSENITHSPYLLSAIQSLSNQLHSASIVLLGKQAEPPDVKLTPREKEILKWLVDGKSNTVIAALLSISENSVKFHLKNIFSKLDISTRQTAVLKAIKNGLIVI